MKEADLGAGTGHREWDGMNQPAVCWGGKDLFIYYYFRVTLLFFSVQRAHLFRLMPSHSK